MIDAIVHVCGAARGESFWDKASVEGYYRKLRPCRSPAAILQKNSSYNDEVYWCILLP